MESDARMLVLDASAVIAWLCKEPGYQVVDRLIPIAVAPASAMAETLYRARERGHRMDSREAYHHLISYGLQMESVEPADSVRAADLIHGSRVGGVVAGSLSLGDGLCIAVAERLGLAITGSDRYWETLDLSVPFHPFR